MSLTRLKEHNANVSMYKDAATGRHGRKVDKALQCSQLLYAGNYGLTFGEPSLPIYRALPSHRLIVFLLLHSIHHHHPLSTLEETTPHLHNQYPLDLLGTLAQNGRHVSGIQCHCDRRATERECCHQQEESDDPVDYWLCPWRLAPSVLHLGVYSLLREQKREGTQASVSLFPLLLAQEERRGRCRGAV